MAKIYHENSSEKKARVSKFITNKVDLRTQKINRNKEDYSMTYRSFHPKKRILSVCAKQKSY